MAFDPTQTGIQGIIASALYFVLSSAEKRLSKRIDTLRNGPVYPRVVHLEGRCDELDLQIDDTNRQIDSIKRQDILPRLEVVERFMRQKIRGES